MSISDGQYLHVASTGSSGPSAKDKDQDLWNPSHQFSQAGPTAAAAEEPGGTPCPGQCCCILLSGREGGEELWLNGSHAPLKDYSCKASAFNGCTDSPEPITAQAVGGRRGLKDVSAREALEHICGR